MQALFRRTPSTRRQEARRVSMGQLSGATALHDAVAKGKVHLARFILEALDGEGPVNSKDKHGKTPLLRAIRIENNHLRAKVMNLLIKHNGDVNAQDNMGRTPLSYACEHFNNDAVLLLVKNNVDPNIEDNDGNTPLMYCSMVGNAEATEIITKSFRRLGLDVDKVNADGLTPLMMAVKRNKVRCASCLIQEGRASIDRKDLVHNMTTIEWAKESGWTQHEMSVLSKRARRTSRIDHVSSGISSNDSSTEQINNLPKITQQNIRDYLTITPDSESRSRSHSAPKDAESVKHDSESNLIRQRLYEADSKRASLPEFIFSHSVKYKEVLNENIPAEIKVGTNGMFIKRNTKKQPQTRPFSGRTRSTRQSKSFDSAIGRDSSSLEDLYDRSDDDVQGKKQKYLLSADPKQLIAMMPLSRSSDALPRYQKIGKTNQMYIGTSSGNSSDSDLLSTQEIQPVTVSRKGDKVTTPQLPPLK